MAALPYRTVARWVQAFHAGRQNATDQPRPGRPSATENQVSSVATLLETDRRWTIRELDCETRLSHTTVLHILKECLHMRKIASCWVPHSLKSRNGSDTSRLGCIWNVTKRKGMHSCNISWRWMRHGRELTSRK